MKLSDLRQEDINRFKAGLKKKGDCLIYSPLEEKPSPFTAVKLPTRNGLKWRTVRTVKLAQVLALGSTEARLRRKCNTRDCCNIDHYVVQK